MLAQNFKTASDLGIGDKEFDALCKVLGMLERAEIPERKFVMTSVGTPECGTPGCILGWARTIHRGTMCRDTTEPLFYPQMGPSPCRAAYKAGTAQAAMALRNFLTYGEPRWSEVMADS